MQNKNGLSRDIITSHEGREREKKEKEISAESTDGFPFRKARLSRGKDTKKLKTKTEQLTPSAPLLSLAAVDDEGGLSLTIFVLGFWLGVDMLLFNLQYPSDRASFFCLSLSLSLL